MRHAPPFRHIVYALLMLAVVASLPSCKKKQVDTVPAQPPATRQPATEPAPPAPPPPSDTEDFQEKDPQVAEIDDSIESLNASGVLQPVYFEYDAYELSPEARATLKRNSDWIKQHGQYRIVVEGHADERGTIEYNLALGQRRAETVRDYLTSLGINGGRLRNISYGEERPAVVGSGESSWSKNRRAAFVIER
jgi:peptidoglycan-associated lipoprotein